MSFTHSILSFFGIHPREQELRGVSGHGAGRDVRTGFSVPVETPTASPEPLSATSATPDTAETRLWRTTRHTPKYAKRIWWPVENDNAQEAGEVDNLRERYSAARYVEHLRDAMNAPPGKAKGRGEWLNRINSLSDDDHRLFMCEVDELIEAGALVHVLSPDEVLQARQRVLDKLEEYQERAKGPELAVPASLMHSMLSTTRAAHVDIVALEPMPEGADAAAEAALQAMEDADIEAWAEPEEGVVERIGSYLFAVTLAGERRCFALYSSKFACTSDEVDAYWRPFDRDAVIRGVVPEELRRKALELIHAVNEEGDTNEEDEEHEIEVEGHEEGRG